MKETQPILQSLAYFQSWGSQFALSVVFRPPVNTSAIENFREKSGLTLPDDLCQYLQITDGETRTSAGMIGNWRLMPIAEIQAAWGLLDKLAEKGAFIDQKPESSPYLREGWWHPKWVPVVTNDDGDYFCLDTDPPAPSRFGQVILYLQNQRQRPLIAGSLSAWFERIARDLAAGLYSFDPGEGFNCEAFMRSALEGKHVFDGFPGKPIA
jgi:cell wall assembly regulator SMI1